MLSFICDGGSIRCGLFEWKRIYKGIHNFISFVIKSVRNISYDFFV